MKARVTISIAEEVLNYVDRTANKKNASRSRVIESLIREHRRQRKEEQLARLAKEFFSQKENAEEAREREDWLRMSTESHKGDR